MTLADKLTVLITNQSEIARKTGIAQSAISEASAGKRRLYVDQAFRVARALGVSLDYLADDAQDEPAAGPGLTADEERVLWLIRELRLTSGELARRLLPSGGEGRVEVLPTLGAVERTGDLRRDEEKRSGPEPEPDRERLVNGDDVPTVRGE